jgi:multidrug transporter EmrE-like cation transporter
VSAVIPFVVALPFLNKKNVTSHKYGIVMAIIAGLAIALFSMALTKSYSLNKVGIVAPIVFGGAIVLSTLFSIIIFKDKTSSIELTGLAVVAVGIALIIYARATTS